MPLESIRKSWVYQAACQRVSHHVMKHIKSSTPTCEGFAPSFENILKEKMKVILELSGQPYPYPIRDIPFVILIPCPHSQLSDTNLFSHFPSSEKGSTT